MELNAEKIYKELAMFIEDMPTDLHLGFKRTVKFREFLKDALSLITSQEQRMKELTADLEAVRSRADETIDALHSEVRELTSENEAWQQRLISEEEKSGKAYYDLACEVEDLRAENERLHETCTEFERKCASLNDENERLKAPRYFAYPDGRIEPIPSKFNTVREFSDRFISELRKDGRMNYYIRKVLDQIVKEMAEGKTAHLHEFMRIKVDAVRAAAVKETFDKLEAKFRISFINGDEENAMLVIGYDDYDAIKKKMGVNKDE